jgi:hypothetical protein
MGATALRIRLHRRRVVLAGCVAAIGCGLALLFVEESHRRYQRMVASYERVRMGMTPSEVRAAVGQPFVPWNNNPAWTEACERNDCWDLVATDGNHRVRAKGEQMTLDIWVDHDLIIQVRYLDGKALDKSLTKTTLDLRLIAEDWFARLRRLFS